MNGLTKKIAIRAIALLALLAVPFAAMAGQYAVDVCQGAGKITVPISAATAGTTSLVAPVTGSYINICSMYINPVGGTATLEYGTGSTCGTGTTTLTGALAAALTITAGNGGNTVIDVGTASQRLCLLAGASSSATTGWITYVQTPVQGY